MKNLLYIFGILFLAISCRKEDNENLDGPSLNDLYGPFEIISDLSLSQSSINFGTDGDLVMNAEFSKNTDWIIEITGKNSGAVRTITGSNRVISSENGAWEGGANTFPAFGLETAYISITFPNEDGSPTLQDSVVITGSKIDDGILITGFESGQGSNWGSTFANAPSSINCGDGESASGDCYLAWDGTVGWDWGIGSVIVRPDTGTFPLPASGNNLFFNMGVNFLENTGDMQCAMILSFQEDENGDGVFDPNNEDAYPYEYWYSEDGWQLVSLNYNDLQFDAEGNKVEVFGNGLPEPSKLLGIDVIYIANPGGGNSKAYIDQIIFTTDEPYRP